MLQATTPTSTKITAPQVPFRCLPTSLHLVPPRESLRPSVLQPQLARTAGITSAIVEPSTTMVDTPTTGSSVDLVFVRLCATASISCVTRRVESIRTQTRFSRLLSSFDRQNWQPGFVQHSAPKSRVTPLSRPLNDLFYGSIGKPTFDSPLKHPCFLPHC